MIVKNPKQGNIQLHFPTVRNGMKEVDYIHIPGGSTVEIEDKLWAKILDAKTTVNVQRRVVTEIESETPITMGKNKVKMVDFEQTGETKEVSLVAEMIKEGRLVVLEDVKVPMETMKALINSNGISVKDMTDDKVLELYNKLK